MVLSHCPVCCNYIETSRCNGAYEKCKQPKPEMRPYPRTPNDKDPRECRS